MSAPIRIGLADDEPLFAQGLAMILGSQQDFAVRWRAVLARFAAMALLAPRPMIPMRSSATMVPPSGECRLWAPSIILVANELCNILDKSVGTSAWADCVVITARFWGSSTGSSGVARCGPPECYGPWRTVWERHRAWARDGALDAGHGRTRPRSHNGPPHPHNPHPAH